MSHAEQFRYSRIMFFNFPEQLLHHNFTKKEKKRKCSKNIKLIFHLNVSDCSAKTFKTTFCKQITESDVKK